MKKSVKYSGSSWFWTIDVIVLCVSLGLIWFSKGEIVRAIVLLAAFACLIVSALFYAPLYVRITDRHVAVRRPLRTRKIRIDDIAAAILCPPTMGAIRVCGSGGLFGYWGWFKERDLGKYFAYYGRSSDCFLLKLKDGRQYVIGCEDAPEVVEVILRHIN